MPDLPKFRAALTDEGFRFIPLSTFARDRNADALLAEIGELHLQLQEMKEVVRQAVSLRAWIHAQPVIFTPSICCPGDELERRIEEADAREALLSSGAVR